PGAAAAAGESDFDRDQWLGERAHWHAEFERVRREQGGDGVDGADAFGRVDRARRARECGKPGTDLDAAVWEAGVQRDGFEVGGGVDPEPGAGRTVWHAERNCEGVCVSGVG